MPIVLKYGSLNLLEPSGPVQACNTIALPFTFETLLAYYYIFLIYLSFFFSKCANVKEGLALYSESPDIGAYTLIYYS